jgi:hypothetical protein
VLDPQTYYEQPSSKGKDILSALLGGRLNESLAHRTHQCHLSKLDQLVFILRRKRRRGCQMQIPKVRVVETRSGIMCLSANILNANHSEGL